MNRREGILNCLTESHKEILDGKMKLGKENPKACILTHYSYAVESFIEKENDKIEICLVCKGGKIEYASYPNKHKPCPTCKGKGWLKREEKDD